MAVVLLDNLPLPSLKSYTIGSLLLFILATIYGYNFHSEISHDEEQNVWQIITSCMAKVPFCTWSTVNMVYCGFFLIGKLIQRFVFGDLRPIELQHIKDKFWNFIFYKFIFIFGVLNVHQMNEAMLWCAWFTIIGFFQLFTQLCCDRFQYLCYSPSTTNVQHGKVISLVAGIIFSCCALTGLSFYVGQQKDAHVFFFLFCEISLLSLKVLHLATKYTIHLLDLKSNSSWHNQKTVTYYSDIGFDVTILVVDMVYHVYMLIYSNIFLSMASLVLCMQLRSLFHDIKHRLAKHRKIIRVRKIVEQRFENASHKMLEEISENKCAICWERMEKAKKLKCGHLFHSDCLCSWLVHDSSCPTCRHSLEEEMKDPSQQGDRLPRRTLLRNHFFHFDGRQIASWFPSFSVEVLHTRVSADQPQIPESRIDTMAHEVQSIFPNIPIHVIRADLTRTHSVDITTDNILEGNVHIPATMAWEEQTGNELQAHSTSPTQNVAELEDFEPSLAPTSAYHEREERQATDSEDAIEEKMTEETSTSAIERTRENERGTFGVDFAELTDQRQVSLSDRKKEMLQNARQRFLEKKRD